MCVFVGNYVTCTYQNAPSQFPLCLRSDSTAVSSAQRLYFNNDCHMPIPKLMVSFMKRAMAALVHKGYGNNYNDCHMYIPKYTYSASLVAVVSTRVNKGCMAIS